MGRRDVKWSAKVIAAFAGVVATVLVAGVVASLVVLRGGDASPGSDEGSSTLERGAVPPTTLRPCSFYPYGDGTTAGVLDGTYVVSLDPASSGMPAAVDFRVDNGSAGVYETEVLIAPTVTVLGAEESDWNLEGLSGEGRAIAALEHVDSMEAEQMTVTVSDRTITRLDPTRTELDRTGIRRNDPCSEGGGNGGCTISDEAVNSNLPGGVDGFLGDDIDAVLGELAGILDGWGMDVDSQWANFSATDCSFLIGQVLAAMTRTSDGYFLTGIVQAGCADSNGSVSAIGAAFEMPLAVQFEACIPGGNAEVEVRYGDMSFEGSAPLTADAVRIKIDREDESPGAALLRLTDEGGRVLFLQLLLLPAGDFAAS